MGQEAAIVASWTEQKALELGAFVGALRSVTSCSESFPRVETERGGGKVDGGGWWSNRVELGRAVPSNEFQCPPSHF